LLYCFLVHVVLFLFRTKQFRRWRKLNKARPPTLLNWRLTISVWTSYRSHLVAPCTWHSVQLYSRSLFLYWCMRLCKSCPNLDDKQSIFSISNVVTNFAHITMYCETPSIPVRTQKQQKNQLGLMKWATNQPIWI
jgi:hypothetical protein